MIELSTHIEYLLLCREEVSVPGLGTFTVREMSSRRVDDEGIFLPPYRTVSFRWDSNEAGEAFIASLSKLHGLSLHEARIMCVEYADELSRLMDLPVVCTTVPPNVDVPGIESQYLVQPYVKTPWE
jgi:hypothetical protein